jgi:hypothetical protein
MADHNGDSNKPRILPFTPLAGKAAPSLPARKSTGPTIEDIRLIARDVARQEFVVASNGLAKKVHEVIARHVGPINQKFAEFYRTINNLIILVDTMQLHLEAKGSIDKAKFEEEFKRAAQEAMASMRAAQKAVQDGKLSVSVGDPSVEEVAEGAPAGNPEEVKDTQDGV